METLAGALPPLWILAAASLVVVCGAIIQSSIGMGFGLTVAPVLAVLDQDLVPGPILMMGFLTAGAGALREWRHVNAGEVGTALSGRLVGGIMAAWAITILPDRSTFSLVFGLTILASLLLAIAGWRMPFTMPNLAAMGWVSGLTGTITGVGAPPLAMVYQDRAALAARPTLNAFFSIGSLMSLILLALAGWAGLNDVVVALAFLPAMALGLNLARIVRPYVDHRFRLAMWSLSGIAALFLIGRAVL
jgi:uncharacterized membrane protein YfcA